jgi:hypothetical protein
VCNLHRLRQFWCSTRFQLIGPSCLEAAIKAAREWAFALEVRSFIGLKGCRKSIGEGDGAMPLPCRLLRSKPQTSNRGNFAKASRCAFTVTPP